MMDNDGQPCCAAEALWRIRKIPVNGIPAGISKLDEGIAAVRAMNLPSETLIRAALPADIRRAKYIPPAAEAAYADALMAEYCQIPGPLGGCRCGMVRNTGNNRNGD